MARHIASGVSSIINFGNDSSLYLQLGDISVGVWVKLGSGSDSNDIISQYGYNGESLATNTAYYLALAGGSGAWDILYIHEYGGGTNQAYTFNTNIANNIWTYIGISRDVTAKTVKLWKGDGETLSLVDTYTYATQPAGGTSGELTLFGFAGTGIRRLEDASLGNFTYHSRALSEGEHYAQMQGLIPLDNLLLWAPLGESSPEVDWSGNAKTGTISGATSIVPGPPIISPFFGDSKFYSDITPPILLEFNLDIDTTCSLRKLEYISPSFSCNFSESISSVIVDYISSIFAFDLNETVSARQVKRINPTFQLGIRLKYLFPANTAFEITLIPVNVIGTIDLVMPYCFVTSIKNNSYISSDTIKQSGTNFPQHKS